MKIVQVWRQGAGGSSLLLKNLDEFLTRQWNYSGQLKAILQHLSIRVCDVEMEI